MAIQCFLKPYYTIPYIAEDPKEKIYSLYEGSLSPSDLPFDTKIYLTAERISKLMIGSDGVSSLAEYEGSNFKVQFFSNSIYEIERRHLSSMKISIPCLINSEKIVLEVACDDMQKKLNSKSLSVYALDQIPDRILGSGVIGQVYRVTSTVIKIHRQFVNVREGKKFYPERLSINQNHCVTVKAADKYNMLSSFRYTWKEAEKYNKLIESKHYPKFYGIVYIRELNTWSLLTEFIEGKHPPEYFSNTLEAISTMISILRGLMLLDKQGYPQMDLKPSNILIRNHTAVFFDDITRRNISEDLSNELRKLFATLLFRALNENVLGLREQDIPNQEWVTANKAAIEISVDSEMSCLLMDAWSEKSMGDFGWDAIEKALLSYQQKLKTQAMT